MAITICGQGSSKDILDRAMFRQLSNYLAGKGRNISGMTKGEVNFFQTLNFTITFFQVKKIKRLKGNNQY